MSTEIIEDAIKEIEIPKHTNVTDIMLKRGYPLRAVELVQEKDALYGQALDYARSIWKDYIVRGDSTIVLCGGNGVGKTTMATLWAYHRLKKGLNCGHYETPYEFSLPFELSRVHTPYFVMDNFVWSAFEDKQRILRFLDMRYQSKLITVIITPDDQNEFLSHTPEFLVDRYQSNGCIVDCKWEGYRKTRMTENDNY